MNKSDILGGLKDLWSSERTKRSDLKSCDSPLSQDQKKTIKFGKFLDYNDYNEDRFQPIFFYRNGMKIQWKHYYQYDVIYVIK